jgi:putative DNA primase/helicase
MSVQSHIADHYLRAEETYRELATVALDDDELVTLGNVDRENWYVSRPSSSPEWRKERRASTLRHDFDDLRMGGRTMYAAVNYFAPLDLATWKGWRWNSETDSAEWEGDENALPDYSAIRAYAPFVDIDLADGVKEKRPEGDVPQEEIEAALRTWVDAFADLAGDVDAVHVLDSVGGVYIMLPPTTTAPLAAAYQGETRAKVVEEFCDRLNDWLENVQARVDEKHPDLKGVFEADIINHKNRLFKAPLSVHSSLDGVVTPIDAGNPRFDYTPITELDDRMRQRARLWAKSFTGDYRECAEPVVSRLWGREAADAETWKGAVDAWLESEKEKEHEQQRRRVEGKNSRGDGLNITSKEIAPSRQVGKAVDRLDARDVAEKTIVSDWTRTARTSTGVEAFTPIWARGGCNGTANIVSEDVWTDTGAGDHGGPVEMALLGSSGVSWMRGKKARGKDWVRGVEELRALGFRVPLPRQEPRDDMSNYYALPLESIAREQIGDAKELFETPKKLLKACLHARDDYGADVDDAPPYKALVGVAQVLELALEEAADGSLRLPSSSKSTAEWAFDEMEPADVTLE